MAAEPLGVSELIGLAEAGGSFKDGSFKAMVIGAVGMAGASGKESFRLGAELHRLRCSSQADRWGYAMAILRKQVLGLARKRRWRRVTAQVVERLCDYALREWLFDICIPCQGTGSVFGGCVVEENGQREIRMRCDCCGGSGKGAPPITERMKALEIGVEGYMAIWEERFEEVVGLLHKAYGITQRSVAKRMARKVEDA